MKTLGLSADLQRVIEKSESKSIQLGTLLNAAGDRAFGLVLIVLSIPSALPIPATGISTPLGIAMFLLALQMMAGRTTLWVPEKLRRLKIPISTARKMVDGLSWILRLFEKFLRPRWSWMEERTGHFIVGLLVALLSVVMQIPIPLTNTLPAMGIFLLALCLTEDDGMLGIIASTIASLIVTAYVVGFTALLFLGFKSFDQLFQWIQSQI